MKDVDHPWKGKNIILVEDILDTGLTLTYLKKHASGAQPKSLKIAALLDKVSRRTQPIHGDYVGFEIPDEFVVGYGLDFAERYRNLPDICVLETDAIRRRICSVPMSVNFFVLWRAIRRDLLRRLALGAPASSITPC